MKVVFTESFQRDYKKLPAGVQKSLDKALKFLITNPRHPSLQSKKIPATSIWYARLSKVYRFTFQFENDSVILRRVGTHKILDQERRTI